MGVPALVVDVSFSDSKIQVAAINQQKRYEVKYDAQLLRPFTELANNSAVLEFLELCLVLYGVDRLIARPAKGWARRFAIRFPVNPARVQRWRGAIGDLEALLYATTGDYVHVEPVGRWFTSHADQRLSHFELSRDSIPTVALLSDGLDSMAGAAHLASHDAGPLALVSVLTNNRRIGRVGTVLDALRRQTKARVSQHLLKTNLINGDIASSEKSQRFRTVLAIAAGLTVAACYGAKDLTIFENGFGLLNLPVPGLQSLHESSQVLNPRNMYLWSVISSQLLNGASLRYPNRFRTKAEMLSFLPSWALPLVAITSSCDAPQRESGGTVKECGICGSCIYRRLSVDVSSVSKYDHVYAASQSHSMISPKDVLCYHAHRLEEALSHDDPWPALCRYQHSLYGLAEHETERSHVIAGTISLLRRHVSEVSSWEANAA